MQDGQRNMVPPDGGWGWMVVVGVSIVNVSTINFEKLKAMLWMF